MDLSLYKETELEQWIYRHYRKHRFFYPGDLEIESVAHSFDVEIRYYNHLSQAQWLDDEYAFIFLNAYLDLKKKREVFFHELCHPLRHAGIQGVNIPKSLEYWQEIQASQFQFYAAIPVYMLEEFKYVSPPLLVKVVAEEFCLPEDFVKKRIEQIKNRIYWAEVDARQKEARHRKPPKVSSEYIRSLMEEFGRKRLEEKEARKRG